MSKLDRLKESVGRNIGAIAPTEPGLVKSFQERLAEVPAPPEKRAPVAAHDGGDESPAAKPKAAKKAEHKTGRIERVSISMPSEDLARITKVRKRAARRGDIYPKSHIVRAALIHFDGLEDSKILEILESVPVLKAGRDAAED